MANWSTILRPDGKQSVSATRTSDRISLMIRASHDWRAPQECIDLTDSEASALLSFLLRALESGSHYSSADYIDRRRGAYLRFLYRRWGPDSNGHWEELANVVRENGGYFGASGWCIRALVVVLERSLAEEPA